jgi:AcrR family transcriptional regulator
MTDNKVDTEKLILEAARKVFIRKGFDGARMQEIADEAGINKALLHYYFRSKDKLFKMVFREAMGKFFPLMLTMLGSEDLSIESKIESFVENYIGIIKENPFIPAFIIGELNKNADQLTDFFVNSGIDVSKVSILIKDVIAKEAGITPQQARHLVVNIIALSVFPYVARPLLERVIFQSDSQEFELFMTERKKVIMDLIKNSLFSNKQ